MPTPAAAVRFVMSGKLGTSQTWSTGFWWSEALETDPQSAEDLQRNVDAVAPAVSTWWANGANVLNRSDLSLLQVAAYSYAPGAAKASAGAVHFLTGLVGTSPSPALPSYVSMVGSLRTAKLGASYRGRMYIPATAATISSAHLFPAQDIGVQSAALAALLSDVNDAVGNPPQYQPGRGVVIRSEAASALTPVTFVVVDDRPDTQHRREDKIGSLARSTAAVTAPA